MSAPEVRILTVKQPWAWAIIHGGKDVENRVRNIAGEYRGPVAIHAGLSWDPFWPEDGPIEDAMLDEMHRLRHREPWPWNEHRGAIIGVVDLVNVHEGHNTEQDQFRAVRSCFQPGKPFGPCSPWAEPDRWHLTFANPRPLVEPIPYRGAQGLTRLPADVAARVLAGVAS